MRKFICFSFLLFTFLAPLNGVFSAYKLQQGSLAQEDQVATIFEKEHYQSGVQAIETKQWKLALEEFHIVLENSVDRKLLKESLYYLGVAYYHLEEYQLANRKFRSYLKQSTTPKYFENVMKYKFAIAQQYQKGAKKHLFGWSKMPKWVSGKEDALEIYDEISLSLPGNEVAAKALFAKAQLLGKEGEYEECADTYLTLIQRFPKTSLTAKSFAALSVLYLKQSQQMHKDPDLITLASINLKRFQNSFPKDVKIATAATNIAQMRELFAKEMFNHAELFLRMGKLKAATLYFYTTLVKYPTTKIAQESKQRLEKYKEILKEIDLPYESLK